LFPGSPTVRINGEDVEPTLATIPSLACRLYENLSGIPSEELLRIAISNAQCGVEIAATQFAPSYRRATVMQATCAAVGLLASFAARLSGASFWWVVAGVLLGSVIPFTLIVILPTNKQLLSPALDRRSAAAERLLARWVGFTRCEVC
jgi:hypothetical protein